MLKGLTEIISHAHSFIASDLLNDYEFSKQVIIQLKQVVEAIETGDKEKGVSAILSHFDLVEGRVFKETK